MNNRTGKIITVSVSAFLAICTAVVSALPITDKAVPSADGAFSVKENNSVTTLSNITASDIITAEDLEKYAGRPETFEFEEKGYKNKYEQILAEDGFIYGMDYDWFPVNGAFPYHISDNHILGAKTTFDEYLVELDIYNIAAMGYNAVNIWLITDGQGLLFDDEGTVTGIDPVFLENFEKILIMCRKYDIACVPSILPHGYATNYGNGNNVERPKEIWDKYFRFYYEDEAREAFIDNAVTPLCKMMADYQDVIPICNLTIENMSSTVSDEELGILYGSERGITWEQFKSTVNALHYAVKAEMPNVMTSTENMGDYFFQFISNETEVDLIGQNRYNGDGNAQNPVTEYITKPTYIGEFNGGESGFDDYSQEYWGKIKLKFFPSARDLGYIGAFYFSYCSGGDQFSFFDDISSNYESIRSYALQMSYQINEMIKEHRGDGTSLYTPTLLYNKGNKDVYWLPGKGVSSFKLERSDDGGQTWQTVADNISIDDCSLTNGLCKYTDESISDGYKYCFRVTSYDGEGNSAVSEPNNAAELYVPQECVLDGGFETTENVPASETSTGWYGNGFGNISDQEAHSGSYSLGGYTENASAWGSTYQYVKVKPNTAYRITLWYKGYMGSACMQVIDPDGNVVTNSSAWMTAGTPAEDEEIVWKEASVSFSVGDYDTIRIKICHTPYAGTDHNEFYFDDISCKENR